MAVVERTVIAAGGGNYTTLAGANNAAEHATTINAGDIYKIIISDDSDYDESITISAGTTQSATAHTWLTTAPANRHAGVWNTGKARIGYTGGNTAVIQLESDFVFLEGLQIYRPSTGSMGSSDEAVRVTSSASNNCLMSYCIGWTDEGAGSADTDGVYMGNWTIASLRLDHCLFYGWDRGGVHPQQYTGNPANGHNVRFDHCFLTYNGRAGTEANLHTRNASVTPSTITSYNTIYRQSNSDLTTGLDVSRDSGTIVLDGSHNVAENFSTGFTNNWTNTVSASAGVVDTDTANAVIIDTAAGPPTAAVNLTLQDLANNVALGAGTNQIGSEPDPRQDFSVDIAGNTRATTNVDIGPWDISNQTGAAVELATSGTGVATATGTLTRSAALATSDAGIATATATLARSAALATTGTGIATVSGALSLGPAALRTSGTGIATATGALSKTSAMQTTGTGVATASGTVTRSAALATSSAGVATVSGTLTRAAELATTGTGVATVSGLLSIAGTVELATAGVGIATATGTLERVAALSTSDTGVATATGTLTRTAGLQTSSAGVATVTGVLSIAGTVSLSTSGTGVATATGVLSRSAALSSAGTGAAAVTGNLTASAALSTTGTGVATVTGALSIGAAQLRTSGIGVATATGLLTRAAGLQTSGVGVATGTAVLERTAAMASTAAGVATLTGTLTAPDPFVPPPTTDWAGMMRWIRATERESAAREDMFCPNDGWPLTEIDGVLVCGFDGWTNR